MKKVSLIVLLILFCFSANAQSKKKGILNSDFRINSGRHYDNPPLYLLNGIILNGNLTELNLVISVIYIRTVHPGKAGLNTGMAAFGIFISGPGAALYFGMEAFHPGGWPGFFENYGDMSLRLQNVYGPSFHLVPFGPK